ncbi:unnamed protein product [Caenorhabditis brenneri]
MNPKDRRWGQPEEIYAELIDRQLAESLEATCRCRAAMVEQKKPKNGLRFNCLSSSGNLASTTRRTPSFQACKTLIIMDSKRCSPPTLHRRRIDFRLDQWIAD